MKRTEKIWRADLNKYWLAGQSNFKIKIEFIDDESQAMKKTLALLEFGSDGHTVEFVLAKENKRKAFVEWLKDIQKVFGEAIVTLDGMKVEE